VTKNRVTKNRVTKNSLIENRLTKTRLTRLTERAQPSSPAGGDELAPVWDGNPLIRDLAASRGLQRLTPRDG